jgi:hypothetical protein
VPFTLAHGAAALPFRRTRLIPSAVVVGTFAPDLEYFLRLKPGGGYGHTLPGAFLLSLPMALATLWMFHRVVKVPFTLLLPIRLQRRLAPFAGEFRFRGARNFALIVVSILVGIATHILWDSCTHQDYWLYGHWALLGQTVRMPFGRVLHYYQLFQYLSSVLGCAILLVWFVVWYRNARESEPPFETHLSALGRSTILISVLLVAVAGGLVRAYLELGFPGQRFGRNDFVGQALCAIVALAWWQLFAFGLLASRLMRSESRVYTQM